MERRKLSKFHKKNCENKKINHIERKKVKKKIHIKNQSTGIWLEIYFRFKNKYRKGTEKRIKFQKRNKEKKKNFYIDLNITY